MAQLILAEGYSAGSVRGMGLDDIAVDKQRIRDRIWSALEREGVARFPGAKGRIPNFRGAEAAAERLAATDPWRRASAIKANPDAPQLPVRTQALAEGKRVYMAVPRLASERPFTLLDPGSLEVAPRRAASIKGAAQHGSPVTIDEMERIDLVVCGTVAVNRKGVRVGKGGGYSDLEFALLSEVGLIDDSTAIATTVHELQVVDEELPETAHDFRVHEIATPERVHTCRRSRRKLLGVLWDHLERDRIDAIPVLSALAPDRS